MLSLRKDNCYRRIVLLLKYKRAFKWTLILTPIIDDDICINKKYATLLWNSIQKDEDTNEDQGITKILRWLDWKTKSLYPR